HRRTRHLTPITKRTSAWPRVSFGAMAITLMSVATQTNAAGAADCAALQGVVVANTTITSATYVTPTTGASYCQVNATVAPEHDVQVRLPDIWKSRIVQNGGGGFDGG